MKKVVRHQVDAQNTTPLGYGGCYSVQRWTVVRYKYRHLKITPFPEIDLIFTLSYRVTDSI